MSANLENPAVATGLEKSAFIPVSKKGSAEECSNCHVCVCLSSSVCGILQARMNTGMGCHSLVQSIFSTQGLNPNGNPLQYSCLENPMDRRASWAAVRGFAKSQSWLNGFTFTPTLWADSLPSEPPGKPSNCHTVALISHARKVMLKSFKLGFSSMWAKNFICTNWG